MFAGHHLLDAAIDRVRCRHIAEAQKTRHRGGLDIEGQAGRTQALEFGGKVALPAALRQEQRLDTEAVAHQMQRLLVPVPRASANMPLRSSIVAATPRRATNSTIVSVSE